MLPIFTTNKLLWINCLGILKSIYPHNINVLNISIQVSTCLLAMELTIFIFKKNVSKCPYNVLVSHRWTLDFEIDSFLYICPQVTTTTNPNIMSLVYKNIGDPLVYICVTHIHSIHSKLIPRHNRNMCDPIIQTKIQHLTWIWSPWGHLILLWWEKRIHIYWRYVFYTLHFKPSFF